MLLHLRIIGTKINSEYLNLQVLNTDILYFFKKYHELGTESSRLEEIRLELGLKKKEMAIAMGIQPNYYSNILAGNGQGNLRTDHLVALKEKHNVNPSWVLTGEGMPFLGERESIGADGPSKKQIQALYDYTLKRRAIKELTPAQEYQFKAACVRSYIDNPQLRTLEQLYVASNIYLNFILRFPGIEI